MMNRIILIGNGFDLAHGLPTSYKDFIQGYWIFQRRRLLEDTSDPTDGLCCIKIDNPDDIKKLEHFSWILDNSMFRFQRGWQQQQQIEEYNNFFNSLPLKYESRFFEAINQSIELRNWVDIESEYYAWLKNIFKQDKCEYTDPVQLNEELDLIKGYLTGYLKFVFQNQIKPELIKDCIRTTIYEPFKTRDISNEGKEAFLQFVDERWEKAENKENTERCIFSRKYGYSFRDMESDIEYYKKVTNNLLSNHITNVETTPTDIPDYYLLPDQILFLNFNYTRTADLYITKDSDFKINHIHGELDNDRNPIIFGYGDEMDEDYKTISNLNDNSYLTNIKSIRYLETDNYRRLLRFIDSAPYQIYIMGHSCGNSDRTLLNTLFEHKNCVSIKPYYYEWIDDNRVRADNYIELVQNISRNFNDMQKMRDRVVNKSYCQPLTPVNGQP